MSLRLVILLGLMLIFNQGWMVSGQRYQFRHYGIEEGICHPFVYTLIQDEKGYLWLGTGEGLCRFDGFSFDGDFTADSLPDAFVKKSLKDTRGNIWFGHNDGNVTLLEGDELRTLTRDFNISSTINDLAEDPEGRIIAATQNQGLFIINKQGDVLHIREPFQRKLLASLAFTPEGKLLVGAYDGIHLYDYDFTGDTISYIGRIPQSPYTRITDILYDQKAGVYWLGAQDEGLYAMRLPGDDPEAASFVKIGENEGLQYTTVLSIAKDREGNLWLSTQGEGVYKISMNPADLSLGALTRFDEGNGLGSRFIREVYQDLEGNIWIATYGNGLAGLFNEAFTFHEYEDRMGQTISSVLDTRDGYWMAGWGKLVRIIDGIQQTREEFTANQGVPQDRITALYEDDQGTLWLGTAESGLYRKAAGSRRISPYYVSENSLENIINAIDGLDGTLWVGTNNGVLSIDRNTGQRERFGIGPRIPHNKINDVFTDSRDNVWIATPSNGLVSVNTEEEVRVSRETVLEFVSVTEDEFGNLWAASANDGIFRFLSDTIETGTGYYGTMNGLKSNACYSITYDGEGYIWVGHRLGLSKIDIEQGMAISYGTEDGINGDCQPNAIAVSEQGEVLFGTSEGLIVYDTRKERRNLTPPITSILSVRINDVEYDFTEPIVLPYNRYKLRIDFIGINFADPENVRYQYILDGYDEWSEPTTLNFVNYGRIEDGNYTFMVRACNSEDVCTDQPVQFSLRVKLPIWKTWWFISLLVILLVATVYFIIKFRERRAKQFQEMLQTKLDERTREVVLQKEEIEVKNKDITDSINYAQRIQASILPPISKLQETFSDTFVFYQPRDIVSGDFYWYDQVAEHKFVIVCADSTGHGVPGAFMSMIGTTLIKDITVRKEVDSPADLLATLDKEIMSALNQNIEAERSNDGMDIIVSEINLKTNKLRISSAMRPMIIYKGGEQIYVRGSRSSVGGEYEKEEKVFESNEFELSRGDKIYMFSDGYPDQFGGPLGKKFKMVRVKNMLRDIHDKPMEEQYQYIKNNFEIWKEDLEQVDDVLFMGIEI